MLAEEEIGPCIIAMDGRRSRCTKSERQLIGDGTVTRQLKSHPPNIRENNFQDVSDAKLLRKLEAQGQFASKKAVSGTCSKQNQPLSGSYFHVVFWCILFFYIWMRLTSQLEISHITL